MVAEYAPKGQGKRKTHPENYVTGPDPVRRNKYYAWIKHRNQARFRGEDYDLTFEDWCTLWTDERWEQRGKKSENLCLCRTDRTASWSLANCEIVPRYDLLVYNAQHRKPRKS